MDNKACLCEDLSRVMFDKNVTDIYKTMIKSHVNTLKSMFDVVTLKFSDVDVSIARSRLIPFQYLMIELSNKSVWHLNRTHKNFMVLLAYVEELKPTERNKIVRSLRTNHGQVPGDYDPSSIHWSIIDDANWFGIPADHITSLIQLVELNNNDVLFKRLKVLLESNGYRMLVDHMKLFTGSPTREGVIVTYVQIVVKDNINLSNMTKKLHSDIMATPNTGSNHKGLITTDKDAVATYPVGLIRKFIDNAPAIVYRSGSPAENEQKVSILQTLQRIQGKLRGH
jgi:hypothetical protein